MEKTELKAYTSQPEPNSSYLSKTQGVPSIQEPMSGSTLGMLMILSTFQYQAPPVSATYARAVDQVGHAAYVQSGGQEMQDRITSKAENTAKDVAHQIGITDAEIGVVLGGAKIYKDKQVDFTGPRLYFIRTHVTAGPGHGLVSFKVDF